MTSANFNCVTITIRAGMRAIPLQFQGFALSARILDHGASPIPGVSTAVEGVAEGPDELRRGLDRTRLEDPTHER